MPNSEIFIGDFARAVEKLDPCDPSAVESIREMLGLDPLARRPKTAEPLEWKKPANLTPHQQPVDWTPNPETQRGGPQQVTSSATGDAVAVKLPKVKSGSGEVELPTWHHGSKLDPPRARRPDYAPDSLLDPIGIRAILTAALSTLGRDGPIDLDEVIDRLSRREVLEELPQCAVTSLRRGVQLLIDRSASMEPFYADQFQLLQQVRSITTEDLLTVRYFTGCPSRGIEAPGDDEATRWKPPPQKCCLAIVSDLGIGGPATASDRAHVTEWLRFVRHVRSHGSSLVALVPYGPDRWPAALAHRMAIVEWDRNTTVSCVVHAVRRLAGRL